MINNILTPFVNASGGPLVRGNVVRLAVSGSNNVTKSQATSAAGVLGTVGVVNSGVVANGGNLQAAVFGQAFVLLESGLTLVAGQTLYVSSATAGLATNVAPVVNALPIGTIEDASAYTRTGGVIANVSAALTTVTSSSGGGTADWTIGITRVYTVDGVNGNDSNIGYATPATTSTADYAIACTAAGLVAKKTIAGISAILPRLGAGRNVEIVWANGGSNTVFNYAGAMRDAIGGCVGYASFETRATGTNTTAGCVAFDGSVADCTYLGFLTCTGMNTAGYSPTGSPTTTTVQCTLFGGGAPGFAAEAAANLPLGAVVRYDAAAPTAALRNIRRKIEKVAGTDTFTFATALPAVPVAGDTFYIEMPGVQFTTCGIGAMAQLAGASFQMAGFQFTTSCTITDTRTNMAGCWSASFTGSECPAFTLGAFYTHPVRGTITPGGGRAAGAVSSTGCVTTLSSIHSTTTISVTSPRSCSVSAGVVCANLTMTNVSQATSAATIGSTSALVSVPVRCLAINGVGALTLLGGGGNINIQQIECNNAAGSCISVQNSRWNIELASAVAGTGSVTGIGVGVNTWGLNLYNISNGVYTSDNRINLSLNTPPTITGTTGDLIISQNVLTMTWAQVTVNGNGMVDTQGNKFCVAGYNSHNPIFRSGTLFGGVGATFTYIGDSGTELANNTLPYNYGGMGFTLSGLTVKPRANTMTGNSTVTVMRNGVAFQTITIPAGSTAMAVLSIIAGNLAPFVGGATPDTFDVRLDRAAADAGKILDVAVTLAAVG